MPASLASVLAVLDQVVHNARVGERRRITQVAEIVLGNFPENAPHDLTGSCFRQPGSPLQQIRRRDRADLFANPLSPLLREFGARLQSLQVFHHLGPGVDARRPIRGQRRGRRVEERETSQLTHHCKVARSRPLAEEEAAALQLRVEGVEKAPVAFFDHLRGDVVRAYDTEPTDLAVPDDLLDRGDLLVTDVCSRPMR